MKFAVMLFLRGAIEMISEKYSRYKQVTHLKDVQEGDTIAYYCPYQKKEVEAEVLGVLEPIIENIIICRHLDEEIADLVDFHQNPVFLISSKSHQHYRQDVCECGAKFTSNPHFHLHYCPLSKERKEIA